MAQNWNHVELSKATKASGGPEKYVEMLNLASKKAEKWGYFLDLEWRLQVLRYLLQLPLR